MNKLAHKLESEELAQKLIAAGLDNPAKIRSATNKDLEAAVGKSKAAKVRATLPKR